MNLVMSWLRQVGTGAVVAALALLTFGAPIDAQTSEIELLDDAIAAVESGDAAGYSQIVDLISVSGIWLPDLGHRALRLQDGDDLRLVWLLFESDDFELYELAVSVLSLERDAIAFQLPDDEEGRAFVQDVDRQAEAIMQVLDHRRIPMPDSARPVMRRLPSGEAGPPPPLEDYDDAIGGFATLATGGTVELSPVPPTVSPTTIAPAPNPVAGVAPAPRPSAQAPIADAARPQSESPALLVVAIVLGGLAVSVGVLATARGRRADHSGDVALTDRLTGLHNRRRFDNDLTREAEFGERPTALVVVEVDRLSGADDAAVHTIGDEDLEAIATTITRTIRRNDVAYRYSALEFSVLLSATTRQEAVRVAERVHSAIAALRLESGGHVSASVGIATGRAEGVTEIVGRADDAVAQAKRTGRDRVSVAPVA
jgi:diguanylate cyclase (GGDEF)-like protein